MIFESHAHYDDSAFDTDREDLLSQIISSGVTHVLNVGASMESCRKTLELIEKFPNMYAALGIHPCDTSDLTEEDLQWLKENSRNERVVAIGEIGLDYYWKDVEKETQKVWFERQLGLAREIKLPVIIHSRDAAKDTLELMKENHAEEIGGVVHCYSYSKEMAAEFLKLDFYFGIGGVITFPNAAKLKEAVEYLPMERILLETDCPYLAPVPNRGKRNNSLNLTYIAQEIAMIKNLPYPKVVEQTFENAQRLFLSKRDRI